MIRIGERRLTIEDVWNVAVKMEKVEISDEAKEMIITSRKRIEKILEDKKVVYGINTGFGDFSRIRISEDELKTLQKNLIMSHAVGVGNYFSKEIVRAIMLLRINALSIGYSGITLEAVETLVEMLNKGVHPLVPEKGSVGASGDLAPLAHVMLVLMGEGKAEYQGEEMTGKDAMEKAGIKPHTLLAKEGLALINGTQVMTAVGTLALYEAKKLAKISDILGATTTDALLGTDKAFDERLHLVRPHRGQINSAQNLRNMMKDSEIRASHINCEEVQDAYSLRTMPQVHGASKDAIRYAQSVLETEINSVTDNPIIFEDEAISGGNFHGQPVAIVMDFLKIAVAELANISERRLNRLVHPAYSKKLPAFLVEKGGVNSGWMIPQYVAASLVSENKVLAHPASVDSIPTSAGQEDHVSMGTTAARQLRDIVDNVYNVFAIEMIAAVQGLEFRKPLKGGKGVQKVYEMVREDIAPLGDDRWYKEDIDKAYSILKKDEFIENIEKEIGELLV